MVGMAPGAYRRVNARRWTIPAFAVGSKHLLLPPNPMSGGPKFGGPKFGGPKCSGGPKFGGPKMIGGPK